MNVSDERTVQGRKGTKKMPLLAMLSLFVFEEARADYSVTNLGDMLIGGGVSLDTRVSADGKVAVGRVTMNNGDVHLFKYTDDGQMRDLGMINSSTWLFTVSGVSANGATFVGQSVTMYGIQTAYKYTDTQGLQVLRTLGGGESFATGVSADGKIVVGGSNLANGYTQAYKHTDSLGMQNLGDLGGAYSYATAISADGTVIVGEAAVANGRIQAFKYTDSGGMQELNNWTGYTSSAKAVSANGSVIVGQVATGNGLGSNNQWHAFKYTDRAGVAVTQNLNLMSQGSWINAVASANFVSADGSVTVGSWFAPSNPHYTFKHVDGGVMVDIGSLGGTRGTNAAALSADGSTIVGFSNTATGEWQAFVHTDKEGMVALKNLGGRQSEATSVSADGKVIGGYSSIANGQPRAVLWRRNAVIDPGNTVIDTGNTITALNQTAAQAWNVLDMRNAQLQMLMREDCQVETASYCIGTGTSYLNNRGAREAAANLTLGLRLSPLWRLGFNLNQGLDASLPSNYKSSSHVPGVGLFAQFNTRKDGMGWQMRLAAAYQQSKVDIRRKQLLNTEAGTGRADIKGKAVSVEGSRRFALPDDLMVEPYAALRYSNISRSAYSETGDIAFGGDYAAMGRITSSVDAGLRITKRLGAQLDLSLDAGLTRDLAVSQRNFRVAMDYVGKLNRASGQDKRTRARLGLRSRYALSTNSAIKAGVHWSQQAYGYNATDIGVTYVRQF